MIREVEGGSLLGANVEAVVNPVNCVGVMGAGLAAQFRHHYPFNYADYQFACRSGEVVPGCMFLHERRRLDLPRLIINFPTKNHWRDKSRLEDIASGLQSLLSVLKDREIRSVAVPALGCGLGGLGWDDVRPLIVGVLGDLDKVEVLLYPPRRGLHQSVILL